MNPHYADPLVTLYAGDCLEVLAGMDAGSVDAVVTDPPYGLEFMGKEWDRFKTGRAARYAAGGKMISQETIADRRGKGGAGPVYVSRPALRCISCGKQKWSGSPCKCEKPEWREDNSPLHAFQAWCEAWGREALRVTKPGGYLLAFGGTRTHHRLVCGLEDAGWIIRDELDWIYASGFPKGKANLKPAHEPIVLARKPGPLRPLAIDECRLLTSDTLHSGGLQQPMPGDSRDGAALGMFQPGTPKTFEQHPAGRWPSNVLLTDAELFDTANPGVVGSGAVTSSGVMAGGTVRKPDVEANKTAYGLFGGNATDEDTYGDSGGYSRFFIIPKADRSDREPVLRGQLAEGRVGGRNRADGRQWDIPGSTIANNKPNRENVHPTVKPVDLMRHLIRLVTPAGGTVLDCFLGSGSTAIAAEMEGFAWIGIEKEPEYVAIAEARLNGVQRGLGLDVPAPRYDKPDDDAA